jgi:hypothetical protein
MLSRLSPSSQDLSMSDGVRLVMGAASDDPRKSGIPLTSRRAGHLWTDGATNSNWRQLTPAAEVR